MNFNISKCVHHLIKAIAFMSCPAHTLFAEHHIIIYYVSWMKEHNIEQKIFLVALDSEMMLKW